MRFWWLWLVLARLWRSGLRKNSVGDAFFRQFGQVGEIRIKGPEMKPRNIVEGVSGPYKSNYRIGKIIWENRENRRPTVGTIEAGDPPEIVSSKI